MGGHHEKAGYAEAVSSYSWRGSFGDILERALVRWRCGASGRTVGTARRGQDGCERPHSCGLWQRHPENAKPAEHQPAELGLPGGHSWNHAVAAIDGVEHLRARNGLLLVVAPHVPVLVRAHCPEDVQ